MQFSTTSAWHGLLGGILIGLAAAVALLAHGRVAGISGTLGRVLEHDDDGGFGFRVAFLAGMAIVGLAARGVAPAAIGAPVASVPVLAVAGLLVGIGTTLSNGCTSGHGVCGLAQLSPRSLAATLCFMAAGVATVLVVRHLLGR